MKIRLLIAGLCLILVSQLDGQSGSVEGKVLSADGAVPFASLQVQGSTVSATTDHEGRFEILDIPYGEHVILLRSVGYEKSNEKVLIDSPTKKLDFEMTASTLLLDPVVVTGTRTFKRQTEAPVIVNVLDMKTVENVQACNLSDALNFQTGLRVETDCQTCGYTQLRMNGLGGGYSQILINGRPIFSPLTGLYGLEQIPVNMIERIETVRGGGSSLYGSSAIGGTVNVITRLPDDNGFSVSSNYQNVGGQANDLMLNANATVVSEDEKTGLALYVNNRNRDWYDHNGDNFSELPKLRNTSFGSTLFLRPDEDRKFEFSFGSLNEYRYGGELREGPAHLAQQAEERQHRVYLGSADYQQNFNEGNSSLIVYLSAQHTERTHFTGVQPDDSLEVIDYLLDSPYGTSLNSTYQIGAQLNHRLKDFIAGENVLTIGTEWLVDDIYDEIPTYRFLVDQRTEDLGAFVQSDWQITRSINLLSGVRFDKHNLLDEPVFSPRFSLLYRLQDYTQFRMGYSSGFRAPQAFDSDLHIAFAGGGVSRISLANDLREERSRSLNASINFDKPKEDMIYGFTLEAFHTYLEGAFTQVSIGEDQFGEQFEKRNGQGATVQGVSLETRANFNRQLQIEAGFTIQTSRFNEPVINVDGLPAQDRFLRTPNEYGSIAVSIFPEKDFSANFNLVYTGEMLLSHFAGAPEQSQDIYATTPSFSDIGMKVSYGLDLGQSGNRIHLYGGVKNALNSYQDDFDTGKNRDSNYIYGAALPRTIYFGVSLGA